MPLNTQTSDSPVDNLVLSGFPMYRYFGTLVTGQGVLAKGTVLGKITTGGKLKMLDDASSDGSETYYAILLEDRDTTSADREAPIALTGVFNKDSLVVGGVTDIETHRASMRALSTYMEDVIDVTVI